MDTQEILSEIRDLARSAGQTEGYFCHRLFRNRNLPDRLENRIRYERELRIALSDEKERQRKERVAK